MSKEKVCQEILNELFEGYLEYHGTPAFDISDTCAKYGFNAHEIGSYLKQNGWLQEHRFMPTTFEASINLNGIKMIRPDWYNDRFNKIISTLGINGNDWTGILEILDMQRLDYKIAHDLGKDLERSGYVEWQPQDDVYVKLTRRGLEYFEINKAKFGNN